MKPKPPHVLQWSLVALQAGEDATELKEKTAALKEKLAEAEAEEQRIISERDAALAPIGNLVHDSVPVDDDEVQLPLPRILCDFDWCITSASYGLWLLNDAPDVHQDSVALQHHVEHVSIALRNGNMFNVVLQCY